MLKLNWQAAQIQGVRPYQEDAFAIIAQRAIHYRGAAYPLTGVDFPEHLAVLIMVDGMGGMGHGDTAAMLITESFIEAVINAILDGQTQADALHTALRAANDRIATAVIEKPEQQGMGATLIAMLIDLQNRSAQWVSVGDSLLIRFRDQRWEQLNQPHTWHWLAAQRRERGEAVDEDRIARMGDSLCAAVDGTPLTIIDRPSQDCTVLPGDLWLLASDGLNPLPQAHRQQVLSDAADALQSGETSLQFALGALFASLARVDHPHQDNCSIILTGLLADG